MSAGLDSGDVRPASWGIDAEGLGWIEIDGVTVLDHSRDETHNRSVVTFAGEAQSVVRAATADALRIRVVELETSAASDIGSWPSANARRAS